jgi:phage-related holin
LVGVALVFFVVAVLAVFYMLGRQGHIVLVLTGLLCISGTLWNAGIYYLNSGTGFLPIVQKISTVAWVAWVMAVYYQPVTRAKIAASAQ